MYLCIEKHSWILDFDYDLVSDSKNLSEMWAEIPKEILQPSKENWVYENLPGQQSHYIVRKGV